MKMPSHYRELLLSHYDTMLHSPSEEQNITSFQSLIYSQSVCSSEYLGI